jgi:hypothetical protein
MTTKTVLTAQDIALLALGGAPVAPVAAPEVVAPVAAAPEVVAPVAAAPEVVEPVVAAAPEAAAPESELVTFLTAQVKEKDTAILAAAMLAKEQTAKLAGIEATHSALVDIVRASAGKMQVALGGTASDLAAFTDVQVLAEHARVAGVFLEKFKVGGVAITAPAEKAEVTAAVADPLREARLAATRPSK